MDKLGSVSSDICIYLAYLSDNLHSYIISHFLVNMIDEVYMYIEIASYFCATLCRE